MWFLLNLVIFAGGVIVAAGALLSATRTFVLPRSAPDQLARTVFLLIRYLFNLRIKRMRSYVERDRIMAIYAPTALLALLVSWLATVLFGYTLLFWALGVRPLRAAFTLSGSSLLTLGFAVARDLPTTILAFSEAAIGLILVAVLIGYLPTIYTAFARREQAVALLEVRAGSPPSPVEMLLRFHRIQGADRLREQWPLWEQWFVDIDESHTSLTPLVFFRSPQPDRSWVTAAGVVLDAAALQASTIDVPRDAQAELCIRAGYLALRHIADYFGIAYGLRPEPGDPLSPSHISIKRAEYDTAYDQLLAAGLALKPDRDQAWRDFAGWRINYDAVLLALAELTMAPPAQWSTDRLPERRHPPLLPIVRPRRRAG